MKSNTKRSNQNNTTKGEQMNHKDTIQKNLIKQNNYVHPLVQNNILVTVNSKKIYRDSHEANGTRKLKDYTLEALTLQEFMLLNLDLDFEKYTRRKSDNEEKEKIKYLALPNATKYL
jgi:hypothetical protein